MIIKLKGESIELGDWQRVGCEPNFYYGITYTSFFWLRRQINHTSNWNSAGFIVEPYLGIEKCNRRFFGKCSELFNIWNSSKIELPDNAEESKKILDHFLTNLETYEIFL